MKPDYYHVVDETGESIYSSTFPEACHDHINDALVTGTCDENYLEEIRNWRVEGLYKRPQKPLSRDTITELSQTANAAVGVWVEFARAIEAAHGIGEEND